MGPKKASMCKTCRQDFSDERKQKGTSIQCGQCFYFIKSHPIYKGMPSKQLQEELADDEKFGTYLTGLTEWEENRQAGKSRSRTQSVTTSAETKASMHTRSLKGYLWTKELCEKKGCGELFKSRSKCLTSVQHMGKTVTGILRDVNCLGAIEIYEDSSVSAIRSNVAGEADAMDCDAVSEQNQLFTNLIQQIKSQETEDGDGNSGLKAAARKDDDFLDLWGVSSSVGGPSSSNRNRGSEGTCAEASRPPKKQKITKKLAAGVVGQPSTSDSADTASQSGQASASSLSSSWMFSGRLNMKGGKAKQSEHHKDFEQTERAIAQVEQLKVAVTNPASYLGLTFAKCRSVLEKIQSRNTDALQKLYRESGLNGDAQGLDLLKRTCECCKQASAIVDVVSALHDPESSAETLASALADARLENVDVPQNADQICHARLLTELSKAQNWSEYFKQIDVDHVKPVFGDGVEDDSLLDFQASSLLTAMRSILMQEVKLDNAPSDEKEAAKQLISLQDKMILAGSCFIDGFFDANIAKFMEDKPNFSNLFEDMLKFKIVFAALLRSKERRLGDAEIEALKGARQHLIGNKKGLFYETLTLFPLGQCVAGKAADIVNAAYHDKGLIAELDSVVESLSTLKPFTQDSILRKVIKDTVADFEIQIPMSNKMFDVVSKYSMICNTASEHFRSERHRDLDAVGAKIDELSLALHAAVSTKFCNRHGTSIIDGITALLDGKMDVQKSTEFCKALESAASFVPFNKALVNKALGETRGAVLNQFLQDNKEFYTKISGATSVLFPFLESQAEVGASTLLTPSLVPLIEAMQNETMLANVPKMVPKLMWPLKRLQQKILSAAKVAMARETASVITLMSKFQDGEVDLNALMDTNLVGAVVESEGDETTLKEVNFGRIYELYFAKINSDGNADANKCYIENGSEKLEVSPTVLCAGKVIHHVLRNIAHLSGIMKEASEKPPMVENLTPPKASKLYVGCKLQHLVDSGAKCVSKCIQSLQEATTSLETIPCDVAKSSLQQCKEKLGDQIKLFVTDLSGEVSGVQRHIQQVLPKLLDEFKLSESLESDSYDPSMVKAACADARVQILYHLMCLGKPGILSALSTLQSMAMICKNFAELPVYSAAATWTDAVIADVSKFAEGDLKNQSGLAFTGYALGNITLAQSVYRELSTGETRQNLVFKALNGVKARGFKCNQKLLQKCEAILKGHGSKQAK